MGSAESRSEEKPPSDMSARRKSACKSASDNGSDNSSCCCNDNQERDNGSRNETNNAPSCSLQPTCCPYPEFTLSTSGICYVQCKFCCQMYPCCCAECPNCGGRPGKTSKEVEIPDIAFCPCCGQESPKANGLQSFCKPTPCCMCIDTCAERELIAKCLQRSFRQARGERRKSCCECQPEQEEDNSKGTNDRDKSERFRYPAYKSAVPCTCESDEDTADNSQPEHVEDCCCERHKTSERQCEANHKRTQQRQSRDTREQCCKGERKRSGSQPDCAKDCCCERYKTSDRQCEANQTRSQQRQSRGTRAQCCKAERKSSGSQPESAEDCCCERQCQPNSCANYKRTQQRQSRYTRAQCCKAERQRSVESCTCSQCESNSCANQRRTQQKQSRCTRAQCCKAERQRSVESCTCSQCESNSCANQRRTQQKQSRCTRAQCCKAKRQRSVQCCACNSRGQRQNYGDYPSVAHCPCGCEVEIKNITYSLPVCRLDDEDDDNECCCCNK